MPAVTTFARRHWFLLALAIVLLVGMSAGPVAERWAEAFPRRALIAAILFITALPVNLSRMATAHGVRTAIGIALLTNAVLAPLVGYAASWLLPATFAGGLFAATASPCTMASAAVWTRRGGGNDAVALAVTLLTSLGCFVILPGWTWLLLGERVSVPAVSLATMLLLCVALPVGLAQLVRRAQPIANWADTAKPWLSLAGQIGILGIVLIGAVGAGVELRSLSEPIGPSSWVTVVGAALAVHVVLLLVGWRTALACGLARPEAVAVAVAGSQKTLAVGVGIAAAFGPLALLPMIAYHVVQLVVDTLFVDRVRGGLEQSALRT